MYPNPGFPIGSIYLSVVNTNPSAYFGGKWEQIAQGRTLVGVDTSQTEFNTVKKVGGSKYLQKHQHFLNTTPRDGAVAWVNGVQRFTYDYNALGSANTYQAGVSEAGTGNSGNLQPYFCVYIWCRIA